MPSELASAPRPLRIALLGYRSKPHAGGQGIYLSYLSRALVDAGHVVDVISGPPYPELDPRVRLIRIPSLDLYEHGLRSLRPRHLRSLGNLVEWTSKLTGGFAEPYTFGRRVCRYLQVAADDYDILHDNQSLSYGMLRLQRRGLTLVTTIHHPITRDRDIALDQARGWGERLLIRRWYSFLRMQVRVARRLDHVITVSERARDDIAEAFHRPPATIGVIHNGIDTERFRPLSSVQRRSDLLVATASADAPLKGLSVLLDAMAQLRGRFPMLRLVVVGRARPGGATARRLEQLSLQDCVEFRSGLSTAALVELYAEATVAVVPSLYEGFGLPAGEAMACATPVVSSDGGALPEIVADAGLVVPAGDSGALADAVAGLLADPERRAALGAAGRERVLREFSWASCARRLVAYYREVLARADH